MTFALPDLLRLLRYIERARNPRLYVQLSKNVMHQL